MNRFKDFIRHSHSGFQFHHFAVNHNKLVNAAYEPIQFRSRKKSILKNALSWISLLFVYTLLPFSHSALALESDRNQSITIMSDTAERNEQKGTTTYSGNVVMQQGSMRIDAEKVVIFNDKSKVTKIVASGEPARYQQKPSAKEGKVVAEALRLEYNIAKETLHLINGAFLQQEGTSLSGKRIDYDVKQSVVKAGGDTQQKERVKMVIPARSLKQNEDE